MIKFASLLAVMAAMTGMASAGKRGLVWPWFNENTAMDPARFNVGNGQVSYMYNYETWRPSKTANLNFIGMQHCLDCDSSPISQLATRQQQQGWTDVFSLNEPDLGGISPTTAVNWYLANINPLRIHKGFPAVSSSTAGGQGLDWLASFISICAGRCFHDYINLHWYGTSLSSFQSYITNAHNRFPGEQIVISEFALTAPASQGQQNAFFQSAMSWLDGQSYVTFYFPFIATSPALLSANDGGAVSFVGTGSCSLNNDGSLSPVGQSIA